MISGKILSLDELAAKSADLKAHGKKVVLCHGTFDLVHMGHIRHLQRAREEGDVLLVTLTADRHVNKGPGRPVFEQALRAENLASLVWVDYVAIVKEPTAIAAIEAVRPDAYVKGADYRNENEDLTGNIARERAAVESAGGRLVITDDITFSSSNLLNQHFGVFPPETRSYLHRFRERYSSDDVIGSLKSLRDLNVLVIGDAIVDEYHYVSTLGQTGKGNVMAVKYESEERFAGGSIAVANHIAGFAQQVTLVTGLGTIDSHEQYVRSRLKRNVKPEIFFFPDSPTVRKRRFVDGDMGKLFEVYFYDEGPVLGQEEARLVDWLAGHGGRYDAVVVPDFGNGFISPPVVEAIADNARFLAVNTQINSGNRGYHVIQRYPRADVISLNEPEIRLAAHNRHAPLDSIACAVGSAMQARAVAVTRGLKGAMISRCPGGETINVPALSTKVVDRIGAGDAFLSLWGITQAKGLDTDLAGFVASVAAALDVQIVCNRESVDPVQLYKYITTLLK